MSAENYLQVHTNILTCIVFKIHYKHTFINKLKLIYQFFTLKQYDWKQYVMVKGNNNFMPNLWINEGYLYTFHIFISLPEYTLKVSAHESLCHTFNWMEFTYAPL